MQIFIKTLTGNTITLDCDSLDGLKQQILEREGLDIDRQRLNYGGKELDAESLSDGITVHLSSRMMGGKDYDPLQKYIALIVLSVIIGIFLVFWPIFYVIRKNWGSHITNMKEPLDNMLKSMKESGKTGIWWVLEMCANLIYFIPMILVILVGGGLSGMKYAFKAVAAVTNTDMSSAKTKLNALISKGSAATNATASAVNAVGTGVVTGVKEYRTHVNKNAMNLPISISIATVLGVGMYYVLKDLSPTEIGIFTPLILLLLFPLIMKYVYKFENWPAEPTNILFILVLIIFSIVQTFKTGDEFSRAIVLNSSIILILSYIAQRYYIDSTRQYYQNVSALDALKNSLLLTGASAVFLVSIL